MTLSAYEVDFEMTYIDGNGRRVGMSLQQIFLADDDTQAMRNGVDWAVSRVEALADAFSKPAFGAIKISEYTIGSYDGIRKEFATNRGFMPFFEWKWDGPSSIYDAMEAFAEKKHSES